MNSQSMNNIKKSYHKKTPTNYSSYKIKETTINNINSILYYKDESIILKKIIKIKNNWVKIYQKNKLNIEKKEELLTIIINNISNLLNNLKINRVYNNSTYLDNKKDQNISNINDITKMVSIEWMKLIESNIPWVSCNEWIKFIYNLLLEITDNDSEVKYEFQVNTNDAHWVLYINIWNSRFSFDSVVNSLSFEKIKKWTHKFKKKNKPVFFNEYEKYRDFSNQEMNKKDTLVYDFDWKKLKIVKKWLFIMIVYKNKPLNFIDIHWLKRITKNISKVPSIKFIWLTPKVYNIDQIKEFILSKLDNDISSHSEVKSILDKLHTEKLLQLFNLSNL